MAQEQQTEDDKKKPGIGLFGKLRAGLNRTRTSFSENLGNLLLGRKEVDAEAVEQLETALLLADVGVTATDAIIAALSARVKRRELNDTAALLKALREELTAMLSTAERPLRVDPTSKPFTILFVGVNGSGKTTTIGKVGAALCNQGYSVLFAAGDTFRAAAIEQLCAWGERIGVPTIAQKRGSDSAAVIYDAMAAARARKVDVVLADTAGRLQNKAHLMAELAKTKRVMAKFGNAAPHEILLVLDAGTGQNGIRQIKEFKATMDVTGLILTKLDGTARGGFVVAAAQEAQLPISFVGVGEGVDDLRPFDAPAFTAALLEPENKG